jgi:hypothetical protein
METTLEILEGKRVILIKYKFKAYWIMEGIFNLCLLSLDFICINSMPVYLIVGLAGDKRQKLTFSDVFALKLLKRYLNAKLMSFHFKEFYP